MEPILKSEEEVNAILSSTDGLLVAHFCTDWAPQCEQVTEVLKELSNEKACSKVKFVQVEAEEAAEISLRYDVEAVPVVLLLNKGAVVDRVDGVQVAEIAKKVRLHAAKPGTTIGYTPPPKESLDDRLKRLVKADEVMVFMKGDPDEPRCGFSRTLVGLLKDKNVKFSYFDILTDDEVRQGLKKFSNWPTYPQVYVNGTLVGGLDIIKELIENEEFEDTFPIQEPLEQRLKKLVSRASIMLFMKGNKNQPRCGFSRQIVDILNSKNVSYDTFDILTDEEVRQGLKDYVQWKTYPQLYVKGEFIGGLDVVKEMEAEGELDDALQV